MPKFNVPTIGSTITVSTYHKSNVIGRTEQDDTTTYENVPVLPNQQWTPSGAFCIPAENEPFIKFRTIAIGSVVDLIIHKGSTADRKHGTIVVPVAGSNDNVYSVVVTDGVATSCDCKGFQYRRNCRHMRIATGETPVNPRRETKKKKTAKKIRKPVVRKGNKSKAELVRELIADAQTKRDTEHNKLIVARIQDIVIEQVIDQIGFKRGLAKSYVLNNWNKVWNYADSN